LPPARATVPPSLRESSSRASSLPACYALGPPASAAQYSCRREPCTGRSPWLPLGRACLSACRDCLRGVSARQCQRIFTNSLTPPSGLGLLVAPRRGFSRSGGAWLGRSQKDGLPSYRGGLFHCGPRPSTRAGGGGSLVAAPFNRKREWTPRRATLLCSRACRSSAQPSP
jgi:hypothetical protein